MKLLKMLLLVLIPTLSFGQTTIFSETCGSGSTTTACSTYTGWSGGATVTATSTYPDVRNSSASSVYSGASGTGNIFFNNTASIGTSGTVNVQFSGINTTNYTSLSLSFGINKSTNAWSNQVIAEISQDGTNWTTISYVSALPTTTGSSNTWYLLTASTTIPATSNLRIRIRYASTSSTTTVRIDDIKVTGCAVPTAPTSLNVTYTSPACSSTTVTLPASTYLQTSSTGTSTSISTTVTATTTFYARTKSTVTGCTNWSTAYGPFTVTIDAKPQITADPQNVTCVAGDKVTFEAQSTYTTSWQISTNSGSSWQTLTIDTPYSIAGNKLKITTQLSQSGNRYRIISINSTCTTTSASALLTVQQPLPITLTYFKAERSGDDNLLVWQTAQEINNQKFIVEKTTDFNQWKLVEEIDGGGNSNTPKTYYLLDKMPQSSITYYRLTQVDFDGISETFKIISINRDIKSTDIVFYDFQEVIKGNATVVKNLECNKVYLKSSNGKIEKVVLIK